MTYRYLNHVSFGSKCMYFVLSSWYAMLFFYIIGMAPSSLMVYLYYNLYKLASKGCKLRQRMNEQIQEQNKKKEEQQLLHRTAGEASLPKSSRTRTLDAPKIVPAETELGKQTKKNKVPSDNISDGPGQSMIGTRINNVNLIAKGKKLYLKPSLVQYQAAILVGVLIAVYFFFITPCYAVYAYWFFCNECVESSWIYYLYPWTGLLNSGLNPILYFSLSKDFRKVLYPLRTKFVKAYNYLIELEYVTTT